MTRGWQSFVGAAVRELHRAGRGSGLRVWGVGFRIPAVCHLGWGLGFRVLVSETQAFRGLAPRLAWTPLLVTSRLAASTTYILVV